VRGDSGFPVRVRFSKRGKVRFISHRDVARAFDRAFRIEALPLVFTAGFVPRPKVSFGLALSVGYESDAEYLDVEIDHAVDLEPWPTTLSEALPDGIEVTGTCALAERADLIERALATPVLETTRTKKGREVVEDVRPMLRAMQVVGATGDVTTVELELATQPRGARPGEIIAAIGEHLTAEHVLRSHQWIERGGARLEPLDADARMRVPEARAS
jgi:uncharacterized protein DUF2344